MGSTLTMREKKGFTRSRGGAERSVLLNFVMAALEAATQCDRVGGRDRVFSRADARLLGGRVKPGHDDIKRTPRLRGSA
jgi:hypothetical protein